MSACKDALRVGQKTDICSTAIVTAGSSTEGYGFSNSIHVDRNDNIGLASCECLARKLSSIQMNSDSAPARKRRYVLGWMERFGVISVPTTCAYELTGDLTNLTERCLMAFFLFPPIQMAVLLEGGTSLQFYGAVIQHQTSAALVVSANKVQYVSADGRLLAWGEGRKSRGSAAPTELPVNVGMEEETEEDGEEEEEMEELEKEYGHEMEDMVTVVARYPVNEREDGNETQEESVDDTADASINNVLGWGVVEDMQGMEESVDESAEGASDRVRGWGIVENMQGIEEFAPIAEELPYNSGSSNSVLTESSDENQMD